MAVMCVYHCRCLHKSLWDFLWYLKWKRTHLLTSYIRYHYKTHKKRFRCAPRWVRMLALFLWCRRSSDFDVDSSRSYANYVFSSDGLMWLTRFCVAGFRWLLRQEINSKPTSHLIFLAYHRWDVKDNTHCLVTYILSLLGFYVAKNGDGRLKFHPWHKPFKSNQA